MEKSVKKKNRLKEKDIIGSVKRANHQQGSMNVSDPTVLVQPGGNSLSSRFARLCVAAIYGASRHTRHTFRFRHKWTAKKENHLKTRKSTSWHSHQRKGHCIISPNIV